MQRSGGVAGTDRLKSSASTRSTGVALLRPQPQVDTAVPEGASSQRQLRRDAAYRRALALADLFAVTLATAVALVPGNTQARLGLFGALALGVVGGEGAGPSER